MRYSALIISNSLFWSLLRVSADYRHPFDFQDARGLGLVEDPLPVVRSVPRRPDLDRLLGR